MENSIVSVKKSNFHLIILNSHVFITFCRVSGGTDVTGSFFYMKYSHHNVKKIGIPHSQGMIVTTILIKLLFSALRLINFNFQFNEMNSISIFCFSVLFSALDFEQTKALSNSALNPHLKKIDLVKAYKIDIFWVFSVEKS